LCSWYLCYLLKERRRRHRLSNKPINMRCIHYLLYFIQSDWKNSSKTICEPGKGDLFLKEKDSNLTIRKRESLTKSYLFQYFHMASSNLTIRVYHKICSRLNSSSTHPYGNILRLLDRL
jgi:hypothetical protein